MLKNVVDILAKELGPLSVTIFQMCAHIGTAIARACELLVPLATIHIIPHIKHIQQIQSCNK